MKTAKIVLKIEVVMVVRRIWFRDLHLKGKMIQKVETPKYNSTVTGPPVDIKGIADHLGCVLRGLPENSKRKGSLSRDEQNNGPWIVSLEGNVSGELNSEQRFTIAHEIAHLFLIKRGQMGPCSPEEYWIMEDVCNDVAVKLLFPPHLGPKQAYLTPSEFVEIHDNIVNKWLLPPEYANSALYEMLANSQAAAHIAHETENGTSSTKVMWSRSKTVPDWPCRYTDIEQNEYPLFWSEGWVQHSTQPNLESRKLAQGYLMRHKNDDVMALNYLSDPQDAPALFHTLD